MESESLIHEALQQALIQHWKVIDPQSALNLAPNLERYLNEVLQTLLLENSAFRNFYPFPVQIRVVRSKEGKFGWGFMTVGDGESLDWLFQTRPEEMARHFPSDRWIRTQLPRVTRDEVISAMARLIEAEGLKDKYGDTLGVLINTGACRGQTDQGTVALARLLERQEGA